MNAFIIVYTLQTHTVITGHDNVLLAIHNLAKQQHWIILSNDVKQKTFKETYAKGQVSVSLGLHNPAGICTVHKRNFWNDLT